MPGLFLALAWFALLLYAMRRVRFFRDAPGLPMRIVALLFAIKVLAGAAVWAVYTYAYPDRATADIFKYFDDSRVLHEALFSKPGDWFRMLFGIGNDTPWFTEQYYSQMNHWVRRWDSGLHNDAHTMIRFNAALRLISFGHYAVHAVFAAWASTVGALALYRALEPMARSAKRGLAITVFLWPSVLFWGSGVLKECLLLLGLGFVLLAAIGSWSRSLDPRRVAVLVLGAALMGMVKAYVLLCLVPPLIAYAWCRWKPGRTGLKFLAVHIVLVSVALLLGRLLPQLDPLYILAMKQSDFIGLTREVPTGSFIDLPLLEPHAWSFLANAPRALANAFISPFAVLGSGPLAWVGALESALLVTVPLLALWRRRAWNAVDKPALLFALAFIVLLALLIGWTVPVVGALVRYRVPLLPFVGLVALIIVDPARLPSRLRKLIAP
ncbi:MAG: hypothetical protein IPK70_16780 [Flavobacteriales bacterium]|jgi:hypothetical protein|nr:hypothetical protein [Flavobacteriales bacterium]